MSKELAELEYERIMESGKLDKSLVDSSWFKRKFIEIYKELAGYTNTQIYKNRVLVEFNPLGELCLETKMMLPDEKGKIPKKNFPIGLMGGYSKGEEVETEGVNIVTNVSFQVKKDGYICIYRNNATSYYIPEKGINYVHNSVTKNTWQNGTEIGILNLSFPTFINSNRLEEPYLTESKFVRDYIPVNGDTVPNPGINGPYHIIVSARYREKNDNVICLSFEEKTYEKLEKSKEIRYMPNGNEYPSEIRPSNPIIGIIKFNPQTGINDVTFDQTRFSSLEAAIDYYRNPNYLMDEKREKGRK